jgi:Domain of unknown function (DUF5665)
MRGMARKPKPTPQPPSPERVQLEIARQAADLTALTELFASRRKLMWVNFVAGLARGVGFFLGVTLVGVLILGLLEVMFDKSAERLGFKDVTLKDLMRTAVVKFEEMRRDAEDAQVELKAEEPPAPAPDAPAAQPEPPASGAVEDQ